MEEKQLIDRLNSSRQLIKNLQVFFAQMAMGDKKYVDPSIVVLELTDDSGRKFTVGNQEDIGTFNDILLSRV